jgi:hypothetical protein
MLGLHTQTVAVLSSLVRSQDDLVSHTKTVYQPQGQGPHVVPKDAIFRQGRRGEERARLGHGPPHVPAEGSGADQWKHLTGSVG